MLKKVLIYIILVLFIGINIVPIADSILLNVKHGTFENKIVNIQHNSNNKTLYVGGEESGNYSKIQDAINDSSDGDTVFVYNDSSPYYENIVIDKTINLIGENKETTIIDGNKVNHIVCISADYVRIRGFTLKNGNNYNGINIYSNYNSISGNIIGSNNFDGTNLLNSNNNTITDNIISLNYRNGICLVESNSNTIKGNTIKYNRVDGIDMYSSDSNNILTNIIFKNGDGMDLLSSTNNFISSNIFAYNDYGIILVYSTYNIISADTITENIEDGILLWHSYRNTIIGNDIRYNYENGIYLLNSSNNTIISNNITSNDKEGVYLHQNSSNNNIYHNNFITIYINAYDECNNNWDDGKYGNYWSDYKEKYPDAKKKLGKGIWDIPYEITEGDNKDMYPLIKQWPNTLSKNLPKNKLLTIPIVYKFLEKLILYFPIFKQVLNYHSIYKLN